MNTNCFNLHFESPDYEEGIRFYRDIIGFPIKQQFDEEKRCGIKAPDGLIMHFSQLI